MGIREVISAPSSPWQNPYVERLIGSIRRECLDHVIVFNETHLRRTLAGYISYYHHARTHLSLAKDAPAPRRVQAVNGGDVIAFPEIGGLHDLRYKATIPSTSARIVANDSLTLEGVQFGTACDARH